MSSSQDNEVDKDSNTQLKLDSKVSVIKDVSNVKSSLLKKLNIVTIRDLLNFFPINYIDFKESLSISNTEIGMNYSIFGKIYDINEKKISSNMIITELTIVDDSATLIASFFNKPWITKQYFKNDNVMVLGKVIFDYGFRRMKNPKIFKIDCKENLMSCPKIISIYKHNNIISNNVLSVIIKNAFEYIKESFNILPSYFLQKYKLMSYSYALFKVHFPDTINEANLARRSLKYYQSLMYFSNYFNKYFELLNQKRNFEYKFTGKNISSFFLKINNNKDNRFYFALAFLTKELSSEIASKSFIRCYSSYDKLIAQFLSISICLDSDQSCVIVSYSDSKILQIKKYLYHFFEDNIVICDYAKYKEGTEYFDNKKKWNKTVYIINYKDINKFKCRCSVAMFILDEAQIYYLDVLDYIKNFQKNNNCYIDILCFSNYLLSQDFVSIMFCGFDQYTININKKVKVDINIVKISQSANLYSSFYKNRIHKDNCLIINPHIMFKQNKSLHNKSNENKYTESINYKIINIDNLLNNTFIQNSGIQKDYIKQYLNLSLKYDCILSNQASDTKISKIHNFCNNKTDVLNILSNFDFEIYTSNINNIIVENAHLYDVTFLLHLKNIFYSCKNFTDDKKLHLIYNSDDSTMLQIAEILNDEPINNAIIKREKNFRCGNFYSFAKQQMKVLRLINIQKDINILNVAKADAINLIESDFNTLNDFSKIFKYEILRNV